MKRALAVTLLSVSLGLPTAVGVAEVCSTKFDQSWADRVHQILAWNRTHPDYVKRRHLDRDMSAETRRARERLKQRLDLVCKPVGVYFGTGPGELAVYDFSIGSHGGWNTEEGYSPALDLESETLNSLIPSKEYPTYDNPSMAYSSTDGFGYSNRNYPVGWPFFYYVSGYSYPIPLGPPVSHPVGPIAPTPEPCTVVLLATGLVGIRLSRKWTN